MLKTKQDGTLYEYHGYTYSVIIPKPHQITVKAADYIERFILECNNMEKTGDYRLTKTQNQIMNMIVKGNCNKQDIVDKLGIQEGTLNAHINGIYSRYGIEGDLKNSKAVIMYLRNSGRLKDDN